MSKGRLLKGGKSPVEFMCIFLELYETNTLPSYVHAFLKPTQSLALSSSSNVGLVKCSVMTIPVLLRSLRHFRTLFLISREMNRIIMTVFFFLFTLRKIWDLSIWSVVRAPFSDGRISFNFFTTHSLNSEPCFFSGTSVRL